MRLSPGPCCHLHAQCLPREEGARPIAIARRANAVPILTSGMERWADFASDSSVLISLYRGMVLTRAFDLKAVSLQRTGRLGTYAVSLGQEGVSVGIASAMREEDVVLPSYRDNGTLLWRGTKMEEILLF